MDYSSTRRRPIGLHHLFDWIEIELNWLQTGPSDSNWAVLCSWYFIQIELKEYSRKKDVSIVIRCWLLASYFLTSCRFPRFPGHPWRPSFLPLFFIFIHLEACRQAGAGRRDRCCCCWGWQTTRDVSSWWWWWWTVAAVHRPYFHSCLNSIDFANSIAVQCSNLKQNNSFN